MRRFRGTRAVAGVLVCLAALAPSAAVAAGAGQARPGPGAVIEGAKTAGFDPVAATEAYLAKLSPEQRARSDAYFEGGYWLHLWGFLLGAAISVLLLATRLSARMRDLAAHLTPIKGLQTALYWVQYLLVVTVVSFPLTVYEGFVREHAYGLSRTRPRGWPSVRSSAPWA
jgi:STE24 endopeptidase